MNVMHCDTNAIYLSYRDITTPAKRELLMLTDSGPRAWDALVAMRGRLARVVQSGAPYAVELAAADTRHDIGCTVLQLTCRIHSLLGTLPGLGHLAERAEAVQAALTFDRPLTAASYVDTAATAARNRNALVDVEGILQAMPVAEDTDAADIAEIFIGGGEAVGEWLAKRADAEAAVNAARRVADGRSLINEARELLLRLRATLEAELSWRDDLPEDLVGQVFAVLDARIAAAAAASRGARDSGEGADAVAELDAAEAAEAAALDAEADVVIRAEGGPLLPEPPAAASGADDARPAPVLDPADAADAPDGDPRPAEGSGGSSTIFIPRSGGE